MAYRLANSCLTRMALVRDASVNGWVACFGGLEEWLPERNPPRTDSQFAEGCIRGAAAGMGMGQSGCVAGPPGTRVAGGRRLVAGAGFVPDSYSADLPLVAARWVYAPVKQGAREMRRIGLAS